MSDPSCAVRIIHVGKVFPRERDPGTLFRVLAGKLLSNGSGRSASFVALKDINLEILKGDKVGVIGDNGAGKTTLLKVVAGLHEPTTGSVSINGEIALLTGFGTGMVDQLSVRENVHLYGAIHGMDSKRIKERFGDIIQWAELENFVGSKLRTLSTGMAARLAFSIIRHIETDIILLDETLTAGDKNFKKKCGEYFENAKNRDQTFLLASHDFGFVQAFCGKTLWLNRGQQMAFGETAEILRLYRNS
jgi:ABC-type polysaccharide/polyol phosphate transport system ATPase subunit